MGNLPRSRPGRRSTKRADAKPAGAAEAATPAARRPGREEGGRPAQGHGDEGDGAKAKPAARPAATPKRPAASAERPGPAPRQEQATHGSTDPVTGAVLLAGKVVEGGLKVAGSIVKRIPRP